MVSLPDAIYIGAGRRLLRFDPRSGRELSAWEIPSFCWGKGVEIEGPLDLTLDPPSALLRRFELILE